MRTERVEFQFTAGVDLDDVEATVKLAFLGASGQHPAPLIRLYARYQLNRARRTVVVIGEEQIAASIAALLVTYLERELGPDAFRTNLKLKRTHAAACGTDA